MGIPATGDCYAGKSRRYALEAASNTSSTNWSTLVDWADIMGAEQIVTYTNVAWPRFYRGRVWLE